MSGKVTLTSRLYDRPGIPKTFDRDADGQHLYPDRDAYVKGLIKYAEEHGVDPKVLLAEYREHVNNLMGGPQDDLDDYFEALLERMYRLNERMKEEAK